MFFKYLGTLENNLILCFRDSCGTISRHTMF